MRLPKRFYGLVLASVFMAGCAAQQTTAFRKFDTTQSESVAIDAKQRVIIVAKKGDRTMYCAEPSPDALSAVGASLAASGKTPEELGGIEAMLQAALAESASSFGVRNATIQLLRDGLYRLCEAHVNEAIDQDEYKRMANKYEDIMVTLLAIEKLTSITAARQTVVLSTSANVDDEKKDESATGTPKASAMPAKIEIQNPNQMNGESIRIIAETVENLVRIMFDYWEEVYKKYAEGDGV